METQPIQPDLMRQQAHALLDVLSAEKLMAVRSLLEVMAEPLSRSLALAPAESGLPSTGRPEHEPISE